MGRTCNNKDVGCCMGNKNDFKSKGLPHLQSEILSPLVLGHWFQTEFKRQSENGLFFIFLGMRNVWDCLGVSSEPMVKYEGIQYLGLKVR